MVLTASKDIAVDEECLISYVDLGRYVDGGERRARLKTLFRFDCVCERCIEDIAECH